MPKLPTVRARVLIQFLERNGFILDHVSGSHFIFYHPVSRRRAVVPRHHRDMPKGTLLALLARQDLPETNGSVSWKEDSRARRDSGHLEACGSRRSLHQIRPAFNMWPFRAGKCRWHNDQMLRIAWRRAAAWRLQRHHLDKRSPAGGTLSVASQLCGLQAQVMSSAELTVRARVEDLRLGDLRRALWEDRTLVKTWAMRGTLHLLPARELPLWHAALSTSRRYRSAAPWKRVLGITLEELDRLTEAVGAALSNRVVTREQLVREVGRITGSAELATKLGEGTWGTILRPAAFTGRLCFGPSLGQRVRFTHPGTWVAASTPPAMDLKMDPAAAQAEVTRRYLAAYAPATYHHVTPGTCCPATCGAGFTGRRGGFHRFCWSMVSCRVSGDTRSRAPASRL